jgi:hypothetical protein
MKALPIKKKAPVEAKPVKKLNVVKSAPKPVKKAPKKIVAPKKATKKVSTETKTSNLPPPLNREEKDLALSGKWKEAARLHCKRNEILYRRSLVAVAIPLRARLHEVLDAIKTELEACR